MKEGLRILILEDDFFNRRLLGSKLKELKHNIVASFDNIEEAIEFVKSNNVDLAILDINLGTDEVNGIAFGHFLMQETQTPFIYLTAYSTTEIIKNAVKTKPSAYLTKPFNIPELVASIEIATSNQFSNEESENIMIKENGLYVKIPFNDLLYVESKGNYLAVVTKQSTYKYRSTLKNFYKQLPSSIFAQVHRAYVVNKDHVSEFSKLFLIVSKTEIPISKKFSAVIEELTETLST